MGMIFVSPTLMGTIGAPNNSTEIRVNKSTSYPFIFGPFLGITTPENNDRLVGPACSSRVESCFGKVWMEMYPTSSRSWHIDLHVG